MRARYYIPKTDEDAAWYEQNARSNLDELLVQIEDRLRDLADSVARHREHGEWARVIHEVAWGVANLNLDRLASLGADAVAARAIAATRDVLKEES